MGRRGAVEYTYFIGHLMTTIRLMQAFGCPDPPNSEIEQMIREIKVGTRQLSDPAAHIR